MHEDDANLRPTLAQLVLTELRSGRTQLSPKAVTALRILGGETAEPVRSPADVSGPRRRVRRTLVAAGVGTTLVALAGGAVLAGGNNHSPRSQAAAPALADAPASVTPTAEPPADTSSWPPATASPSDGPGPAEVPSQRRPTPATMDAGTATTARPAVVDRPAAPPVRREGGPPVIQPEAPAAAASSAPSAGSSPSTTPPTPTPTPTPSSDPPSASASEPAPPPEAEQPPTGSPPGRTSPDHGLGEDGRR
jgi:hypothetical protein